MLLDAEVQVTDPELAQAGKHSQYLTRLSGTDAIRVQGSEAGEAAQGGWLMQVHAGDAQGQQAAARRKRVACGVAWVGFLGLLGQRRAEVHPVVFPVGRTAAFAACTGSNACI